MGAIVDEERKVMVRRGGWLAGGFILLRCPAKQIKFRRLDSRGNHLSSRSYACLELSFRDS